MHRVPIKIYREPVKLPNDLKMQLKLREAQLETREDDILVIARHYEMLAREHLNKGGYSALSRDNYQKHRNWKHFERIYEVCRMKSWDPKLYVESQFDRARNWVSMSYPQPQAMYSVAAFRHFTNYLANIQLKHKYDTNKAQKQKGRQTVSLTTQVVEDIIKSVESLEHYVRLSDFEDKSQYKALRIYNSWEELSPFYLWSVPWFHELVSDLADTAKSKKLKEAFDRISKSNPLQDTITRSVQQIEEHFSLPPNISLF